MLYMQLFCKLFSHKTKDLTFHSKIAVLKSDMFLEKSVVFLGKKIILK